MRELPNIVDGFSYDLWQRPLVTDGYLMALAALEPLRRAGSYRPKLYTVPDADNVFALPAYRTVEEQVRVVPGTFLWGLSGCLMRAGLAPFMLDPTIYVQVRITEQGTGVELTSDFMTLPWPFYFIVWPPGTGLWRHRVILLPEPRPIIEPGHLNIEFINVSLADLTGVQLLLHCAEPCAVVETGAVECRP